MDCSKSLLQGAKATNAYEKLEKQAFGESTFGDEHFEKFDYVISASMINNDGWDQSIFHQLLHFTKMGGYIIFATKLDLKQDN